MHTLVLIRHGESIWNKENRFTGWKDIPLSDKGHEEAKEAGRLLLDEGFEFDVAYTSVLRRAIRTLWHVMEQMDLMWIPVTRSWKLNERHYGALQGLNKSETALQHGEDQVLIWRRAYDTPPPALETSDKRWPGHDRRYAELDPSEIPTTECLKDTVDRVVPYWEQEIAPQIKDGKRVLVAAHGNSLRALVKHLDNISDEDIVELNIPTGMPLIYKLDKDLKPISKQYLGDPEAVQRAMAAVANQGKAK